MTSDRPLLRPQQVAEVHGPPAFCRMTTPLKDGSGTALYLISGVHRAVSGTQRTPGLLHPTYAHSWRSWRNSLGHGGQGLTRRWGAGLHSSAKLLFFQFTGSFPLP